MTTFGTHAYRKAPRPHDISHIMLRWSSRFITGSGLVVSMSSHYGYYPLWLLAVRPTSSYGYFRFRQFLFPLWLLPNRDSQSCPVIDTLFRYIHEAMECLVSEMAIPHVYDVGTLHKQ